MVKPCTCLLARLSAVSDDYAFHFVTGNNTLFGRYAGSKRVFEQMSTSHVVIRDYLTKMPDLNAMRAAVHMLQSAMRR